MRMTVTIELDLKRDGIAGNYTFSGEVPYFYESNPPDGSPGWLEFFSAPGLLRMFAFGPALYNHVTHSYFHSVKDFRERRDTARQHNVELIERITPEFKRWKF